MTRRTRAKTPSKTMQVRDVAILTDIPNVGPAVAADLNQLEIQQPEQLLGRDPWQLYDDLCRLTRTRQDPCVLDTFIAVVRFMEGSPAVPWWHYTAERKREQQKRGRIPL